MLEDSLERLTAGVSAVAEAPAGYAVPYLQAALSLPMTSNGFYASDAEIPLIPLILDGMTAYTLPAANLAGDLQDLLLRCIESKSPLLFQTMAGDYEAVRGTPLQGLYSAAFTSWQGRMTEAYAYVNEALDGLWDQEVTAYRLLTPDVRAVTYANGVTLYINHGGTPYAGEDGEVGAHTYVRTR